MNKWFFMPMAFLVSQISLAAEIQVFTNDQHPVDTTGAIAAGYTVTVHNIDATKRITAKFNKTLHARVGIVSATQAPERYKQAALDIINSPEFDTYAEGFEEAGVGIAEMVKLGVKKVPAIVFDATDVVYGVNSVSRALQIRAAGGQQ